MGANRRDETVLKAARIANQRAEEIRKSELSFLEGVAALNKYKAAFPGKKDPMANLLNAMQEMAEALLKKYPNGPEWIQFQSDASDAELNFNINAEKYNAYLQEIKPLIELSKHFMDNPKFGAKLKQAALKVWTGDDVKKEQLLSNIPIQGVQRAARYPLLFNELLGNAKKFLEASPGSEMPSGLVDSQIRSVDFAVTVNSQQGAELDPLLRAAKISVTTIAADVKEKQNARLAELKAMSPDERFAAYVFEPTREGKNQILSAMSQDEQVEVLKNKIPGRSAILDEVLDVINSQSKSPQVKDDGALDDLAAEQQKEMEDALDAFMAEQATDSDMTSSPNLTTSMDDTVSSASNLTDDEGFENDVDDVEQEVEQKVSPSQPKTREQLQAMLYEMNPELKPAAKASAPEPVVKAPDPQPVAMQPPPSISTPAMSAKPESAKPIQLPSSVSKAKTPADLVNERMRNDFSAFLKTVLTSFNAYKGDTHKVEQDKMMTKVMNLVANLKSNPDINVVAAKENLIKDLQSQLAEINNNKRWYQREGNYSKLLKTQIEKVGNYNGAYLAASSPGTTKQMFQGLNVDAATAKQASIAVTVDPAPKVGDVMAPPTLITPGYNDGNKLSAKVEQSPPNSDERKRPGP